MRGVHILLFSTNNSMYTIYSEYSVDNELFHAKIKCKIGGRCMLVCLLYNMLYCGLPLPSIHDGTSILFRLLILLTYTIYYYYSQSAVNVGILILLVLSLSVATIWNIYVPKGVTEYTI